MGYTKEQQKAYREKNKARIAQTHRKFRENNKEKIRVWNAEYRLKHKKDETSQC